MESIWLIMTISLIANPILSFILVKLTKNYPKFQVRLFQITVSIIIFILLCLLADISTTNEVIDFICLGIAHLSISVLLFLGFYHKGKELRYPALILMLLFFGFGYLLSTIGALGLGLISGSYTPKRTVQINDDILYKEYLTGGAFTSTDGAIVVLYETYSWLPFLEREIFSKSYIGGGHLEYNQYKNLKFISPKDSKINNTRSFRAMSLDIDYDRKNNILILSTQKFNETLRDTLYLNNR